MFNNNIIGSYSWPWRTVSAYSFTTRLFPSHEVYFQNQDAYCFDRVQYMLINMVFSLLHYIDYVLKCI